MDTHKHQKSTAEKPVDKRNEQSATSPPSPSSSPSHEFSFTISLHSSSTSVSDNKTKTPPSFAIDLSPADDIFFHGHLLPLHLLSHLPVSPRSSTNSLDSFTLPIREEPNMDSSHFSNTKGNSKIKQHKSKSKPFSLFGFKNWRKGCEEEKINYKRKLKFDVSHILKRYVRMVRPLLSFKWRKENVQIRRQPYSFSGNLGLRSKQELRGRREVSAPASMRTSPTNSGLLVATTAPLPHSTNDSTMEELQSAIQAAIAHCKNSIAKEEETQMLKSM